MFTSANNNKLEKNNTPEEVATEVPLDNNIKSAKLIEINSEVNQLNSK